jgi:hypothetical protein
MKKNDSVWLGHFGKREVRHGVQDAGDVAPAGLPNGHIRGSSRRVTQKRPLWRGARRVTRSPPEAKL